MTVPAFSPLSFHGPFRAQVTKAMDYRHKHSTKELPTVVVNIQSDTMMALNKDMCVPKHSYPAATGLCLRDRTRNWRSAQRLLSLSCFLVYTSATPGRMRVQSQGHVRGEM